MVSFAVLCWSPFLLGAALLWSHWGAAPGWPPTDEIRDAAIYTANGLAMFCVPLLASFIFARLALDLWRTSGDEVD